MIRTSAARVLALLLFMLLQLAAQAAQTIHAPFYEAVRGKQSIYLLGTMHMGKANFYPMREAINQALERSSTLFLEIHPDELPQVEQHIGRLICPQACLQASLGEVEWNRLVQELGNDTQAIEAVEKFPPWLTSVVLSLGDWMALGYSDRFSVERYLAKRHPNIIGLERSTEQLEQFSGMSAEGQKELLLQWLNMSAGTRLALIGEMAQMWREGDAEEMYNWYRETARKYRGSEQAEAEFHRRLVVGRNRIMLERLFAQLQEMQDKRPVFVAVGALHLGGADGLLALLKKQGYVIKAR